MQFKDKWYYSTPVIALLFAFWFLIIPGILGIIFLILQMKNRRQIMGKYKLLNIDQINKQITEKEKLVSQANEKLQRLSSDNESKAKELDSIKRNIKFVQDKLKNLANEKKSEAKIIKQIEYEKNKLEQLTKNNDQLKKQIEENENKISEFKLTQDDIESAKKELENLKSKIIETNEEVLNQSFGFYEPHYHFENSEQYQNKLKEIRNKQKQMAKTKEAVDYNDNWTLDGSKQKGRALNNDNIRLALRAFNSECDAAINKVKFNNVDTCEKRINASYKAINKANKRNQIEIKKEYLALKYDELYLAYEYEQKKEEEKEEQRQLREQMREEAKVKREIEREKKKIAKEEQHFNNELKRLKDEANETNGDAKLEILNKIEEINKDIEQLGKDKEDVFNREDNTRAGYVYVISNIGSFGENVYKIGVTRRLDPSERVKELGDASVPFPFDIHATIFSDDAPALEAALHREFDERRLNRINRRKEFFNVTLGEIKAVVEKNHDKTVEYTKIAAAQEYRQSLALAKKEVVSQSAS